jgi:hypothetical protein
MFRLSRKPSSGGVTQLHLFICFMKMAFWRAETYVGVFKCFKETLYWIFLNQVHLVGDKILICEKCTVILK